jgi:hypothetical protein
MGSSWGGRKRGIRARFGGDIGHLEEAQDRERLVDVIPPSRIIVPSLMAWVLLIAGCASDEAWTVRTEVVGPRRVEVPTAPLGDGTSGWRSVKQASRDFPPTFHGMEGSPVLDGSGIVRGYVAEARSGIERGLVLVRPIPPRRPLSPKAGQYLRELTYEVPEATPLQPGDSVCLLAYWGDCIQGWAVGTVSEVEGGTVRCVLPDPSFGRGLRRSGPCLYGLARAPVIAFGMRDGQVAKICTPGDLVGTLLEEDGEGLVGQCGVLPKTVELVLTYHVKDALILSRRWFVVRDPERVGDWIVQSLGDVLRGVIVPAGASCTAVVRVNGAEDREIDFTGVYGSDWRRDVENGVWKAVSTRTTGLETVSVWLRLASPSDEPNDP